MEEQEQWGKDEETRMERYAHIFSRPYLINALLVEVTVNNDL